MKKINLILIICTQFLLTACSPVKPLITNQYKLGAFSHKQLSNKFSHRSILVNAPDAVAGYQTDQMLYVQKPFELTAFVHNSWVSPPADMLLPLIVQSLQRSGYFYAVVSSPNGELADYRIDTQLIELQQNFLTKPSVINLAVKVVLSNIKDNRIVASRLFRQQVTCPMETPYGGVIAANRATENFTAELTHFVIAQIKHDSH